MNYLWHILVILGLYTMLGLSLNLVVGYTGLLSLCHAGFYGVGAYTTALLMISLHWGFFPALGVAALFAALLGLVVALPALRLKGDYFVLATLGAQIILYDLFYNWTGLTRGSYGLTGIPVPHVFGWEVGSPFAYFLFVAAFTALCALLLGKLTESPFGRVLRAIRSDEMAMASLGKNTVGFKLTAFCLAAALAAIPGGLFAGYMRYIDPSSFTLMESILILSMVVVGGAGSRSGPMLGALVLVLLPEILRFAQFSDAVAANLRQIIYGVALVVVMRFRPAVIQGEYEFR